MTILTSTRFIGRVASVPASDYGFISLSSVERTDGTLHGISTNNDIFLHQDDCNTALRPGQQVEFDVVEIRNHQGEFRATGAIELLTAELVPVNGSVIPGFSGLTVFNQTAEMQLAKKKLPIHSAMKAVPVATVEQVVANQPMSTVPRQFGRDTKEQEDGLLNAFLQHLFPQLAQFGTDYNVLDSSDEVLEKQVEKVSKDLNDLGMGTHVQKMKNEVARFKELRAVLRFTHEEGLVRPDTIIPIRYLPDIFMAAPVWFYYTPQQEIAKLQETNTSNDPKPHAWTKYFCDLFPENRRWADTFQLYNRRMRTLANYGGDGFDLIPPGIARRLKWAKEAFDFVVIATPYHDLAARDWQDLAWIRSIDPYVFGFKKGIPYIFVLGRFSDSGIFPLYHQLVGDTMEFLRANVGKLKSFNNARNPYWHGARPEVVDGPCQDQLGTHLQTHVRSLLAAFEQGNLFDWLRMEDTSNTPVVQNQR